MTIKKNNNTGLPALKGQQSRWKEERLFTDAFSQILILHTTF